MQHNVASVHHDARSVSHSRQGQNCQDRLEHGGHVEHEHERLAGTTRYHHSTRTGALCATQHLQCRSRNPCVSMYHGSDRNELATLVQYVNDANTSRSRHGTNNRTRNSSKPSTLKYCPDRRHTIGRVRHDARNMSRSKQGQQSLVRHVHGGHVESTLENGQNRPQDRSSASRRK